MKRRYQKPFLARIPIETADILMTSQEDKDYEDSDLILDPDDAEMFE